MTTINLKDFYAWYTHDAYIEVSDEVAAELRADKLHDIGASGGKKPRTYRQKAKNQYIQKTAQSGAVCTAQHQRNTHLSKNLKSE